MNQDESINEGERGRHARHGVTEGSVRLQLYFGAQQQTVEKAVAAMQAAEIIERIWWHDFTVWGDAPTEISNRLGWLFMPRAMVSAVEQVNQLAKDLEREGFRQVLLLGMGGSSLAPELFAKVFGPEANGLTLEVLDSTDPDAILAHKNRLELEKTLFVVATKSGSTVETYSFFKVFYNWMVEAVGRAAAGSHFIAITDPGSKLVTLAEDYDFRKTFLNDPNIGGRYSALSFFGLAPAALVGVDISRLLAEVRSGLPAFGAGESGVNVNEQALWIGAALAEMAKLGRDKLTLITSPGLASFGDWVEQLIAESTGKKGTGILPVVGAAPAGPETYGEDRLFVYLHLAEDDTHDGTVQTLVDAGMPLLDIEISDRYLLGQQMFVWEMATAIAGHLLGIQPFNQPNVESAKVRAREMVEQYQESGALPEDKAAPLAQAALTEFLDQAEAGDYVAIHAYVQPTAETDQLLKMLQQAIRRRTRLATTVGYGPRFLHSTGQLHKGDRGNGLFIQLTSDPAQDVAIPDKAGEDGSSMTFGVLKMAQELGDGQALKGENRRLIRFHLGRDVPGGLKKLGEGLA